ncbi:MAG: GldG family protein [Planctomycetota bacterium]
MIDEPEIKDAEFTVKETNTPNPAEGWGRKQKTMTFFNVLVMVLIALGVLIGVNYVSQRRYFRIDCTFKQEYSLSSKSKEILKQIKEPIIIYTFFVQSQDPVMADVQRMMTDLLEEYKIYSRGKILIELVQPATSPEKVEILQKKFKLETIAPNDMILRSGSNQKNVNLIETFERDEGPYGRSGGLKEFRGEESLTSAIMTMINTQKTTVYFVSGHKEGDITDNSPEGYATFINYLQRENIESKKINLLETTQIPADCNTLVVAGPQSKISMPEQNQINNYLKGGGRVLIMIAPLAETGLSDFLKEWGIKLEEGIIIDPQKCVAFLMKNVTWIVANDYPHHPITEKMASEESILPGACAIASISPTIATEIIKSSSYSWLEKDMDALSKGQARFDKDSDRKGPISVGVAVSKKVGSTGSLQEGDKELRLVVIGSSDMVINKFLDADSPLGFGRVDLTLNSIRWLAGQESFISIEPKKIETKRVDLTPARITFLFWFSMIIIPAIGAVFGIFVWIIRRR